ncbi:MAG TPA: hypothetical protein VMR52_01385 [Dehalococcoidia bacterium]|nr:hypothetical protein [Dehalococcoidia bacterium]
MSLKFNSLRFLTFAMVVGLAALGVSQLRGGVSADSGPQGYDSEDFCNKVAVLEMVMSSGFEHHQNIGMSATVLTEIKCLLDSFEVQPSALIPVRLEGNLPWVDVEGEFVFDGNPYAEGSGTVAGTPNVKVILDAFVSTEYEISGLYTMGADGELGNPAVYALSGVFGTDTIPTPTQPGQTAEPAPTATPAGDPVAWGDNNCSGAPDPVDALLTLRHDAGLNANTGDCPQLGAQVNVLIAAVYAWGDFDCSTAVDPIDALKLLRFDAGLNVGQEAGCPAPGAQVTYATP